MNDFIGNNIKLIVEWGQFISGSIILLFLFLIGLVVRKNKFYLPRGLFQYIASILFLIVTICFALVFARITQMRPAIQPILTRLDGLIDMPAPQLDYHRLADHQLTNIEANRGSVLLVNYWATWCPPCIKEIPDLEAIQKEYGKNGLKVIMLSDEKPDRLRQFQEKHNLSVEIGYIKEEFKWAPVGNERPITFLVDARGTIVHYFTGGHDFDFFEKHVLQALAI